jgi:hypothetical protein
MATVDLEPAADPIEDFPLDSYALMEGRFQILRLLVMKTAASLAAKEAPASSTRVKVTRAHVTKALEALAEEGELVRSVLSTGETKVTKR